MTSNYKTIKKLIALTQLRTNNYFVTDDEDLKLIDFLYKLLDKIQPCGHDNRHELWITLENSRGKKEWFSLLTVEYNSYRTICVGNSCRIMVDPNKTEVNFFEKLKYTELLEWLIFSVEEVIFLLEKGEYNKYIVENLPYDFRMGTIKRKKFYELYPEKQGEEPYKLTEKEILDFIQYVEAGSFDKYGMLESDFFLTQMTANKFFDICSYGYRQNKGVIDSFHISKIDWDTITSFELYKKFADNRDGGLHRFPTELGDSVEDFLDWYKSSDENKWTRRTDNSHSWEVIAGSSRTRIHLYLEYKEDKWFLTLSGNVSYCTEEIVRFYLGLIKKGIYPSLYEAKLLLSKVKCEDEIGIIGCEERSIAYDYGYFPKKNIVNFDNMPSRKKKSFIKAVEWFNFPQVELKH